MNREAAKQKKKTKKNINMKIEWTKLTDRIYCGSVLSSISDPKWYKILNEMFAETQKFGSISKSRFIVSPEQRI